MRYPAAEKLEIIRLVEQSHLPVRRTLARIDVPVTTFYRWYDRYREHGPEGLEDRSPRPAGSGTASPSRCGSDRWRWRSRAGAVATRAGRPLHRPGEVFRLRGFGLPPAQGARPDHQPGLHRGQGGRGVHRARPPRRTSSGRPTSPISRSSAGAGSTCRRSSTTTRDTSSPGSSAPPCAPSDVTDTLELALAASGCDSAGSPPAPPAQRQWRVLHRRRPGTTGSPTRP